MKTIIVFLFLCSIVPAQYNTYDLIIEYEQECFNDSSQVTRHVGGEMGCYGISYGMGEKWKCENPYHYDELVWIHREPSWEGFRGFVKKKYEHLLRVQGAK